MRDELARDLYLKYPKIFPADPKSGRTISFEVGDGWFDLLDALCEIIQHHIDWRVQTLSLLAERGAKLKDNDIEETVPEADLDPDADESAASSLQVVAQQVKEKFAGLRFYYVGGDDEIQGMVSLAEALSTRTCERCGAPGKTNKQGWHRTLCRRHTEQQGLTYDDATQKQNAQDR